MVWRLTKLLLKCFAGRKKAKANSRQSSSSVLWVLHSGSCEYFAISLHCCYFWQHGQNLVWYWAVQRKHLLAPLQPKSKSESNLTRPMLLWTDQPLCCPDQGCCFLVQQQSVTVLDLYVHRDLRELQLQNNFMSCSYSWYLQQCTLPQHCTFFTSADVKIQTDKHSLLNVVNLESQGTNKTSIPNATKLSYWRNHFSSRSGKHRFILASIDTVIFHVY